MTNRYVWYASYGSNLSRERFLCYIRGGRPRGADKEEIGCRDQSLPIDESTHIMHYPLYFAKASERWQNQGVGFIGLTKDERWYTYSRKYLITEEQFTDVVKQENNGATLNVDFDEVIEHGFKTFRDSWYGTILYIGEEEGYPIFTFTADWDLDVLFQQPSSQYLRMIIYGLKSTLSLDKHEIVAYLIDKPGIEGNYKESDIEALVEAEK
ncbi:hypothetical protein J416_13089 [Gracilibacillus halophilus YIM-C55.5]|uniref:Histone deacetylase n=1 Tax=Gracilibacillus halophilus YIM-C55.5 TaxID=1308866 RepID=N4W9S1_9BACI|nr:hypothetical protein [Gracilibacillus halophilus]ENH96014.1 hypothetical protein J416_13089 [Gracilibacillus halophilus YIM-C55.5]